MSRKYIEIKYFTIIEKFDPKDIFNADKIGLFFKCLPNKTLAFKHENCFGGKHSKERVTLVLNVKLN